MTLHRMLTATMLYWLLQFASFGVLAAEHDCAVHCQSHTDKHAKMCVDHCKTGVASDHDCAKHCASQSVDDKDQMCVNHCNKV
jgi:hypothetical protein